MPCFWHVLCRACGLNWEDIVTGGQRLFRNGFRSKWRVPEFQRSSLAHCYVEATLWLGSKLKPSGTQLRGFPRNCIALAHL